jgi:hypothetical protein
LKGISKELYRLEDTKDSLKNESEILGDKVEGSAASCHRPQ